ncbi:T9SS type A sorting domain-containing protein [Tamlana sp. 2_MG-2023]|uniref:T9SS type A sorting domain-containing protein n=1 Tax=unclassified Tamlana TaxID=2614803 RepID=UPI0026E284D1|nr:MULTISPECIES: T9SS type A sorting domain-containing protein [unclassified Tamlana]MDO6759989.1 T9SS type A sorting domain-containing protein [Tamlana sp. 2_MG-2023]MDO6791841.1 T9SS type A sorting domain-containing protein [Tamlana sp. 1_MG-2023]
MKTKYFLIYIGILFSIALQAQNSVTIDNRPSTVNANELITLNVSYTKSFPTARVLVKFYDTNTSSQLDFDIISSITANSGTVSLTVQAPSSVGTNYEIRAQLLENWAGKADDNGVVSVVSGGPSQANSVTILNRPSTVDTNELVTLNVSYTKDFPTARVLVKFYDTNTSSQLDFDIVSSLTANSGTVSLTVQAPSSAGTNYEIRAQLLENWAGKADDNGAVSVVSSTPPSGNNTLDIVNTPANSINNGTIRTVNVQYNAIQPCRIEVEVRNNNIVGTNDIIIGKASKEISSAGNGTVPIELVINNGNPAAVNLLRVLMYNNSGGLISVQNIPSQLLNKGNGVITYRGQIGYENGRWQNEKFEEALGNGYYSNWFVNENWQGDLKAKFGPAEQASWVEWDNNGSSGGPYTHAEFDIKIQKFSWHNDRDKIDRGYPTKIASLNNNVTCTATGQWGPNSEGRTFLNMTAWLYDKSGSIDNTFKRSDIIVHTWDNSGDLHQKYVDNPNDNLEPLSTITSGGITYYVLKRNTGGYGEEATYNIVPTSNPRDGIWQTTFSTTPFSVSLDMRDILEKLIVVDANSDIPVLTNQWYIHGLEWTYIGSSGDTVGGAVIQDSKAKLTLTSYTIPDLNGGSISKASKLSKEASIDLEESVYPNPFSNSLTYKYNSELKGAVTLELFSMDGRRVEIIKSSNRSSNSITFNTSHLNKGLYLLKISSLDATITKKLIKR